MARLFAVLDAPLEKALSVGWFLSIVIIGFPILIGAWIWGIVNGHSSAVTWNRKHGIIS